MGVGPWQSGSCPLSF